MKDSDNRPTPGLGSKKTPPPPIPAAEALVEAEAATPEPAKSSGYLVKGSSFRVKETGTNCPAGIPITLTEEDLATGQVKDLIASGGIVKL